MKKIILGIILFLFLVNFSFAEDNKCEAIKGDNKNFFNCIKKYTEKNKNSFGILDGMFGKTNIKITFGNNIKYEQKFDNGYINNCDININNKKDFIKTLEKWSTGSFGTSDMKYAKCESKDNSSTDNSKNNINGFELIKDYFYKGKNKFYILHSGEGTKVNGKEIEKTFCEIVGSNGEGLKYIGKYIVDSKNIYEDKSFINTSKYKYDCDINKLQLNEQIDIKTLQYLKGGYYKDKNGIYYFYDSSMFKSGTLKIKKLENVDFNTFTVIDNFYKKAQDKNFFYTRGEKKERIKLIKKDNITIDDFKLYNEKLIPGNKSKIAKIYGKIYDFSYSSDIKTNIEGNFIWKLNLGGGNSISNKFENGKSSLYNKFYINDDTNIIDFSIDIYNKDKAEFSFQDGEKIGTIKKKIRFTTNMEKPIFIKEDINNKKQLLKSYIISKNGLSKSKYKKFIPKLNEIVKKINLSKLKEVNGKLDKIDLENKKYQKIKVLIQYLKAKVELEMYERENN